MEPIKAETPFYSEKEVKKSKKNYSFRQAVWRWHFYAGLIFSPFLIILAFSGAVYLFKPQIESSLYHKQYYADSRDASVLPLSEQVNKVKAAYPNAAISSVSQYDDPMRTTEIGISEKSRIKSVYVNPYTGKVQGDLADDQKLTEIFKKLHSELIIGGIFANRLVELAACWAIILLVTGLYLWWPRKKSAIWGTLLPRLHRKGVFWRDLHAVPAFWLSIGLVLLIATGLPWSGVMGEKLNGIAASTKTGYPQFAFAWGEKPESRTKTKDIAKNVPWATENLAVPSSNLNGYIPLSLEEVSDLAKENLVAKPYSITLPQGEKGVYTVTSNHQTPWEDTTLHIDQYSGSVLSDVRFDDYGILAKAITAGIALHEGRLFGLANQLIGLIVCLGLILVVVSSFMMWKKRKPEGKSGAPARIQDRKTAYTVWAIMLAMSLFMPLVFISLIAVYLLDLFVIPRLKPLHAWIN